MVVTRGGFSQVVGNAFASFGFTAEGPSVYEFPVEMFNPGSDLTPISENIDKIVYGLTQWQPKTTTKGIIKPDMITVQGKDYQNAVDSMTGLFSKNMWDDGLPLTPPTVERVKWIESGTELAPDTVIGAITPRGGIATVESVAVALAMAGGRPEYMPVLLAALKAMLDPSYNLGSMSATTSSTYPTVIINGPIAKQLRIGSGYGCLGPDPLHPAGASIGRAIRLIQQNMGGAVPGVGTMAIYGAMRFTGTVFAEDEAGLPKGWDPLAVQRGFKKDQNVVSVMAPNGAVNIEGTNVGSAASASSAMYLMAEMMGVPNENYFVPYDKGTPGVLLIPRYAAQGLSDFGGYTSKDKVKAFLWENSKIPYAVVDRSNPRPDTLPTSKGPGPLNQPWPITSKAENITIVVAGGDQSGHAFWLQTAWTSIPVSAEITLPKSWDALLKQNEADLGPLPALH